MMTNTYEHTLPIRTSLSSKLGPPGLGPKWELN